MDRYCSNAGEKKVFTANMTIGTILAVVGFAMYSQFKLRKHQRKDGPLTSQMPEQEPLSSKNSGEESDFIRVDAK